jgi:hypothetical protein
MKRSTGRWGLGTGVGAIALAATLSSGLAGCAINPSSIHGELSDAEMIAKVTSRFHAGDTGERVKSQLRRSNLSWSVDELRVGELTSRERGIAARIERPGIRVFDWLPTGFLYLWFTPDDRLEGAAYTAMKWRPEFQRRVVPIPLTPGEGS